MHKCRKSNGQYLAPCDLLCIQETICSRNEHQWILHSPPNPSLLSVPSMWGISSYTPWHHPAHCHPIQTNTSIPFKLNVPLVVFSKMGMLVLFGMMRIKEWNCDRSTCTGQTSSLVLRLWSYTAGVVLCETNSSPSTRLRFSNRLQAAR